MSFDTALAEKLRARLGAEVLTIGARLPSAMAHDEYLKTCGMLFAWNYVLDTILPETVEEIQKG